MASPLLSKWTKLSMVDALFNQPDYMAAKKSLDAVELRQQAIASNIANLETPGYQRVDLAPSFQAQLQKACATRDPQQIASLQPALAADPTAVAQGRDGNTVNLEQELMQLDQNTVLNSVETQLVSYNLARLRMAVTGKSS
jgi:flagellar basal-body rod protein FlgB